MVGRTLQSRKLGKKYKNQTIKIEEDYHYEDNCNNTTICTGILEFHAR